jgi:tetratricopeptide (TPR) repeat protein
LLKRIQRYFLDEVAVRVERQMPLPDLLDDLERQLPDWITALPVVWGTPRYAMLRVYRGLTQETAAEPGWQQYKPSAIPSGNTAAVKAACASLVTLREFQAAASELEEGGDVGSAIAVARRATAALPDAPAAWVVLAERLVRGSRRVSSVLEKGDFFVEAVAAMQHALELDPYHLGAHLSIGRFMVMRAYRNGDNPESGMAHLRQVLDSLPSPAQGPQAALAAQAYFYTGMGHRTNGDESQALACFQTALDGLPGFEPALLAQQT